MYIFSFRYFKKARKLTFLKGYTGDFLLFLKFQPIPFINAFK